MNVLIVADTQDLQAITVHLALEEKNIKVHVYDEAECCNQLTNTFTISEGFFSWTNTNQEQIKTPNYENYFDALWWRRGQKPLINNHNRHEKLTALNNTSNTFFEVSPYLFKPDLWWLNPIASHQKTKDNIVQLKLASQCGLKVPPTLVSNSYADIKEFVTANKKSTTLYKPCTSRISIESTMLTFKVYSDSCFSIVPGIYQKQVAQQYAIRVTCFGSHLSAVKVTAQESLNYNLECMISLSDNELNLTPFALPQTLKNKIILFMIKIGVVYGCLDFIVTPDNDFVFIRFNEQGDFLTLEQRLPELHYLDMFCEYIINKNFNFIWRKKVNTLHAEDFASSALNKLNFIQGK